MLQCLYEYQETVHFSLNQEPFRMLVIKFLLLFSAATMASGLDVLNYPEFIKHLEKLEKIRDPINQGKRVEKPDDANPKSLYEIFRGFEMKMTNLIKDLSQLQRSGIAKKSKWWMGRIMITTFH